MSKGICLLGLTRTCQKKITGWRTSNAKEPHRPASRDHVPGGSAGAGASCVSGAVCVFSIRIPVPLTQVLGHANKMTRKLRGNAFRPWLDAGFQITELPVEWRQLRPEIDHRNVHEPAAIRHRMFLRSRDQPLGQALSLPRRIDTEQPEI